MIQLGQYLSAAKIASLLIVSCWSYIFTLYLFLIDSSLFRNLVPYCSWLEQLLPSVPAKIICSSSFLDLVPTYVMPAPPSWFPVFLLALFFPFWLGAVPIYLDYLFLVGSLLFLPLVRLVSRKILICSSAFVMGSALIVLGNH